MQAVWVEAVTPIEMESGAADERAYLLNLLCVAEELVMHLPERVQRKYGLVKGSLALRHGGLHMIAEAGGSAVMASLSTGIQPTIAPFPTGCAPILLADGPGGGGRRFEEERERKHAAPAAARNLAAQLDQFEQVSEGPSKIPCHLSWVHHPAIRVRDGEVVGGAVSWHRHKERNLTANTAISAQLLPHNLHLNYKSSTLSPKHPTLSTASPIIPEP